MRSNNLQMKFWVEKGCGGVASGYRSDERLDRSELQLIGHEWILLPVDNRYGIAVRPWPLAIAEITRGVR
ncbi:hypothetical protein L593_11370 [Salinarchaeum sp. Harcht-Bsk1]|nr:hypothetical protein L593_11370 [Salinarchaeum sp. Harcht-Bsk1]